MLRLLTACTLALIVVTPFAHAAPGSPGEGRPLTADIVCTASKNDRQFGYRYRYDLALTVREGTVRKLKLSQRATSKTGDDQGCAIDLDSLTQVKSDNGILLRETEVAEGGKPRCTIRITANRDRIHVQIGDAGQDGNDCHGGEATMYCSPRSFWSSMVIDRKTKRCKPVE